MRWKHVAVTAGAAVLLVVGLLGGGYWALFSYYSVSAPTPHYPKPKNLAEAQHDDLDYLRHYLTADWSYTTSTRERARAVIDSAQQSLPMSPAKFELTVSRVAALADNGHSNVWPASRANRHNRLPLRTFWFADGLYVVRTLPAAQALSGGRIVAIDGHPISAIRQAMQAYTGGTATFRDVHDLPYFVESPELLHAAGYAAHADREALTVQMPDGRIQTAVIAALPADADAPKLWPNENLPPIPAPGERLGWKAALAGHVHDMLLFSHAREPFYAQALPSQRGYYVRFLQNESSDGHDIGAFTERTMQALAEAQPKKVVIDMRFNGGGDYTTTAHFMRSLPERLPRAIIYVLISPQTFSAGMTSAAFLKQAGGARTIFVGTPPGDRIRFRSEGGAFCLPFSKICMSARTAIHDYSTTKCRPISECFALNWFYPVAIKSFEPDVAAPLTYAALSKGRDPALERIFPGAGL